MGKTTKYFIIIGFIIAISVYFIFFYNYSEFYSKLKKCDEINSMCKEPIYYLNEAEIFWESGTDMSPCFAQHLDLLIKKLKSM